MKKLLLTAAIAAMAAGVQAQDFSDLYKVTYNGQEVKNGDEIVVTEATMEDYGGGYTEWTFEEVKIYVETRTGETLPVYGSLAYDIPTQAEMKSDMDKWGLVSFCYENAVNQGNNCLGSLTAGINGEGYVNIPANGVEPRFFWLIHRESMQDPKVESSFVVTMVACEGDATNREELEELDAFMTLTVKYGTGLGSVSDITNSKGTAEYYSLDGRKLQGPAQNGIYLMKQAGKVSKHIAR